MVCNEAEHFTIGYHGLHPPAATVHLGRRLWDVNPTTMCSTFRPALLFVPLFLTVPCAAQLSITWQHLADLPYAVQSPYMFAVDGRIFVGDGITEHPPLALAGGMHEYLPATDTWVTRTPCPGPDRYGARGFSLNGLGYITCGWANNSPVIQINDTWAYEPSSDTWTPKAPFPGGERYTAISCATSTKGYTCLLYTSPSPRD